jgi:hypothetical protein
VGDRERRPPAHERPKRRMDDASLALSSEAVASSRIRIRGSFSRTRAIASRCFSPPESR